MPLSDTEVICEFMQGLDPRIAPFSSFNIDDLTWWVARHRAGAWEYCTRWMTLDALREVEARLTDSQWQHYAVLMFHVCCTGARTSNLVEDLLTKNRRALLHADAATKTKALAEVLRPIVEAPNAA